MEFTAACEMTAQEITDGDFAHDADSRMSRHVTNARRAPNRWGISISKESPDSPDKIDGCVAMIIARHARRLVLASENYGARSKVKPARSGRVWSWS
jgi:phage terminase large subunit-like protein